MQHTLEALQAAEAKAAQLFEQIESRGLIQVGKTEKELNQEIFDLAFELFGIKKYWHKRIVRAGKNTLLPYKANPPVLTLREEDILFFDFGPVFEEMEADYGRTYVLGQNEKMLQLKKDVEAAWFEGQAYYQQHRETLTCAEFYNYTKDLALRYGWEYGNAHCGHLVGNFPHEQLLGDEIIHYLHPENHSKMSDPDQLGQQRHWIYEVHLVDLGLEIGGFMEQLL